MGIVKTCRIGEEIVLLDLDSEIEKQGKRNHELWRANSFATKEPDTIAWIQEFFEPGDIIYDVGANIGQYSLYAAKLLKSETTVFAFEPEALNYAKLNRNIVLNDLAGTVVPFCLGISDSTGIDRFYSKCFAPGAALHSIGRPVTQGEAAFEPQNEQGVMAVSIDDLIDRFGLPCPQHIKVDVDGIEKRIVAGMAGTLAKDSLHSVLIEVYMFRDAAPRIQDTFAKKGWQLHNEAEIDYTEGKVQNLIFSRPT